MRPTNLDERAPDHVELSTFVQSDSQEDTLGDALQGSKPTGATGFIPGPPWIINILLNELCERFSYYGLRAILPLYFVTLGWSENASISVFMFSSAGAYFCSVFGGIIADTYMGKYNTIIRLSMVYCVGMLLVAMSALFSSSAGLHNWSLFCLNRNRWNQAERSIFRRGPVSTIQYKCRGVNKIFHDILFLHQRWIRCVLYNYTISKKIFWLFCGISYTKLFINGCCVYVLESQETVYT